MRCKMTIQEKRELLDSAKGQYFSVTFKKANGEIREMQCKRWEEQAYTYGSANAQKNTVAHKPSMYTACDSKLHQFRNINLETLIKARVAGVDYEFDQE